ncbi:MAG TPA: hypothetical protein DCM71_06060 [Runella sp.]|nr:hypothetical protein [Runella sp.]
MDKRFGLKTNCLADIFNVLKLQPEVEEALIFGSRAMGTYKNGSDIDIALKGEKITFDTISTIRLRLDELPYLYMYDIIDYKKVSNPAVIAHIDELGITFYKKQAMPREWKTYKLGEIYDFASGLSKSKEFFGKGYDFVIFKDIFQNYFLPEKLTALVETNEIEQKSYSIKKGDVFLRRTSENDTELGLSSVALKDYPNATFNGFTKRLRPKGNVEIIPEFAGFYFRSPKFRAMLSQYATMPTWASLNNEILANLTIDLPNKDTQVQIGRILKSLDEKIDLNLKMNQTLEAMAQAIFKEWFVKFNFPGFDGELVDGLPKGWRLGVLGELVDKLSKGAMPTQKDLASLEVEIPFLKVKDISDNGSILKSNLELIPIEVHQNQLKRSILETDDILFSIAGTIGKVAILDDSLKNSNCNQAIAFIRLKDKEKLLAFVHQWLKNDTVQNNIKSSIVQGVQANVSLTVLSNIEIIIPDDATLHQWNALIKSIYSRLLTNTYQIEYLTQTRDTLLPKLMSGQLEVLVNNTTK